MLTATTTKACCLTISPYANRVCSNQFCRKICCFESYFCYNCCYSLKKGWLILLKNYSVLYFDCLGDSMIAIIIVKVKPVIAVIVAIATGVEVGVIITKFEAITNDTFVTKPTEQ